LRPSILIETKTQKKIVVDTGPDFRTQSLKYGINNLDGVMLTHFHYDHNAGLDELRIFYYRNEKPLPLLLNNETLEDIKRRFYYLFNIDKKSSFFDFHLLKEDFGKSSFCDLDIEHLSYYQNSEKVLGFRFKDEVAYVSDIRSYDQKVIDVLKGVDTLIVSALRPEATKMHFSLQEAIEFAKAINPKKTVLTHIAHEIDHEKVSKELPEGVSLAFDGLELEF
jgi:phosphoribosyl 1,2-cyclic phosphate phosphodiesterase